MSNETANRSHAGIVLQMFADPDPPKILASWGFETATLQRVSPGAGLYTVRLTQAASGLIGPTPILFESIDSLIVSSSVLDLLGGVLFVTAILVPDPALPAPAVGARAQLPILAVQLQDDSGPIDGDGALQLEVRAVPQQD